jgi:hypothetical protein
MIGDRHVWRSWNSRARRKQAKLTKGGFVPIELARLEKLLKKSRSSRIQEQRS